MEKIVKIGDFCVDSGMVYIGDPCYFYRDKRRDEKLTPVEKEIGPEWVDFCNSLDGVPYPQYKDYNQYGVVAQTGCGDGTYPVYATIEGGTITSIKIDFLMGADEEEEEDDDRWDDDDEEAD